MDHLGERPRCKDYGADAGDISPTLRAMNHSESHANGGGQVAIAFSAGNSANAHSMGESEELAPPLRAASSGTNQVPTVMTRQKAVRRITPVEAERLQGFPDNFTLVPYRGKGAADGPRYKAIGNSMAVPCVRWIGRRIALVDARIKETA
jgi:DNA (cytosine-5)-methyltransferase 1